MITPNLQTAIEHLQIQDVYLNWGRSECSDGFLPKYEDCSTLEVQKMHVVERATTFQAEDGSQLLCVYVLLGARWVKPAETDNEPEVKAMVEASFIAEYTFSVEIEQACIDEFAQKNVSYHVWPYWREYLSAQAERMRLPQIILPTMQLAHHKLQGSEA